MVIARTDAGLVSLRNAATHGNPWHTVVSVGTLIHHAFQYLGGPQGKIKPSEPAPTPRLVRLRKASDDGRPSHIVRFSTLYCCRVHVQQVLACTCGLE